MINNCIWTNMIAYFVLSGFWKAILKKTSDFQREDTKESNKNDTCDHSYSTRLASATIHKKNFSPKWIPIVAEVVVSDCSFLFGCVLWSFSKHWYHIDWHLSFSGWDINKMTGHIRSAVSDVRVTSCSADFDQQKRLTGITATGAVLKLRSIDLY